jgi:hypothetical protein
METKGIIQSIEETIMKIKNTEHEYLLKKELLEKELEDKKSDILSQLGFRIGDKVTLQLFEYRDDRIHCFQVAQEGECIIHGVKVARFSDDKVKFLTPVLKRENRKKEINFNEYLSWDLKKDGKVILSHRAEQVIIPETYTEEQIAEFKPRLLFAQKI